MPSRRRLLRAIATACGIALSLSVLSSAGIAPAPADTVEAAGDCTIDATLDGEEKAFLTLINNHRAANGRAPLRPSYMLSKASAWKSKDMGVNRYFGHNDLDRTWDQRMRDCGYTFNTWAGENILAGGSGGAQQAFDAWRNSSGHNANMLSSNFTAIGIGRHYTAGSPYGWYWTTNFGGFDDGYVVMTDPLPPVSAETSPAAPTLDDAVEPVTGRPARERPVRVRRIR
jgi:uncharacterized protein YkwD